jgi:hypothetical protein
MRKLPAFLSLVLVAGSCGAALAAPAQIRPSAIIDHVPQIDGPITTLSGPAGRAVATWTYRSAGEFDIAVATREPGAATWNSPVFFGHRNGMDEADPVLAFNARGSAYISYSTSNPSRVAVSVLEAGATSWSQPVIVSGLDVASAPALMVVGDQLVVAYRVGGRTNIVQVPIGGSVNEIFGVQDGPDAGDSITAKQLPRTPPQNTWSNPGP